MAQRLNALDAIYLCGESSTVPASAAALVLLDCSTRPDGPLTTASAIRLIERRIPLVPRLRQKVAFVPFEAGRPVWVDDPWFEPRFHLRPVVLAAPSGRRELVELVEQVHRGPLDRSRPLWELYVAQGLQADRIAVLFKWHHAMADGLSAVDLIGTLLFGHQPRRRDPAVGASKLPSPLELLYDALAEQSRRSWQVAASGVSLARDLGSLPERVATLARGALALAAMGPPEPSP